jgi:ATP-dependent helicase/nuclease subunit A
MARTCLRHPAVRRAAAVDPRRVWRELAVVAQEGDITTTGRIDLLFEDAGELVLVDYKTDRIGPSDPAALEARHADQMTVYANSLRVVTGLELGRIEIVAARAPAPTGSGR